MGSRTPLPRIGQDQCRGCKSRDWRGAWSCCGSPLPEHPCRALRTAIRRRPPHVPGMILSPGRVAGEPLDAVNQGDLGGEARIVPEEVAARLAEVELGRQEKGNEAVA